MTRGVSVTELLCFVLALQHVDINKVGVDTCDIAVEAESARISIQGEANDVYFLGVYAWDTARGTHILLLLAQSRSHDSKLCDLITL